MPTQRSKAARKADPSAAHGQKAKRTKNLKADDVESVIELEVSPDASLEGSPQKKSFGEILGSNSKGMEYSSGDLLEQINAFSRSEMWVQEHGRVELRKRLKELCNILARIDSLKSFNENRSSSHNLCENSQSGICSTLSNLACVICESGIPFERKSDDLQVFAACVLVEIMRLVDNPFTDLEDALRDKKETSKRKRRVSASEQSSTIAKVLGFLIEQISIGVVESGNQLFPMYFHILEVMSNRASFLLIAEIQNERLQDTLFSNVFESFLGVCEKAVLPQIRDFIYNILKDLVLEPGIQMSGKIIIFMMNRLVSLQSVSVFEYPDLIFLESKRIQKASY
jgi:hypothetical protein